MPDLLIRQLSNSTINKLKARARANQRSVQAELKMIIEDAAAAGSLKVKAKLLAKSIRSQLVGRSHSDSALLIAEDRQR